MTESRPPAVAATSEFALEALGLHWRSGRLLAIAGETAFGVHLDAGRVILATSTQRSLRLGHLLLQLGAIRPSYLDEILHGGRVLDRAQALGRMLVREGAVTRADLATGVEEQCVEVLARMMETPSAVFLHVVDEALPRGIEIVPLETDRLLRAAAIRADHRAAIRAMRRLLPDSDAVLTSLAPAAGLARSLSAAELAVAVSIERGVNQLSDLCSSLDLDPLDVKRALIGLMERGIVAKLA